MKSNRALSVLHICTDFWPSTGGTEQFVLELARHSASIGVSTAVMCFNRVKGRVERLPETETVDGIPVTRIPFINLKFYKPTLLRLGMLRKYDLLHVHGVGAPLDYAVITKCIHGKPIIVSTHGGIFHTTNLLALKRLYFFGFESLVMNGVNAVAACSRSDATLFRKISRRVVLLENAVDITAYMKLPTNGRESGRCLYVGRLSENKGIPALIKAFSEAMRHGAHFNLRLVGPDVDGRTQEYQELTRAFGISEKVHFLGKIDKNALVEEYRLAETFVSASRYEGFGLSAIEAKAGGCRLILNTNEAFRSLFHNDVAVRFVDFSDTSEAGRVIFEVLSSAPRLDISQARKDVAQYSWETKIQAWKALYSKLGV